MDHIKSFKDLHAWQHGHQLAISIYKETTNFPTEERYLLVNQLRRAAVSITSNIAEGFTRKGRKEKAQFYRNSLGSLTEIESQLLICRDIGYITQDTFTHLHEKTIVVSKLLNGLIKRAETFNP